MKKMVIIVAIALLGISASGEPEYPKVDDTCYTEANGDRVIRLSTEVASAPEEIWRVLTTADGWKSFAVAFAFVEMRVGGIIETSYNPKAQAGDPDNIKNEIVAFVPGRMLAIRCVQAPRNFTHKEEFFRTATVIEITPLEGNKKSRVALTAVGYEKGEAYDELYKKFRWGDAYTLEKLRVRFEPTPPPAEAKAKVESK
jgi:uncharacterized protein YndB with AHSA1/START domain